MAEQSNEWTVLAQELASEWGRAHGGPPGAASGLIGVDTFAVLIEDGFTRAERIMMESPASRVLLQEYVQRLLGEVTQGLIGHVEDALGRQVVSSGVTLDPTGGWVVCFFKLGDPINLTG